MKKIFVMLVALSLTGSAYAQNVAIGVPNAAGDLKRVTTEMPLPVVTMGLASSPTFFHLSLSTATPKLLQSIASFTVPCKLEFRSTGFYYAGPATTTLSALQHPTLLVASGAPGYWNLELASTSANIGFLLNSGEVASAFTVIQWPRGRAR